MRAGSHSSGFTLIEVLIVVTIIAILAAVAIPQFSSSTEDAFESALEYNMNGIRKQIQAYEAQHFGDFPTIQGDDLPQLTGATNVYGEIGASGPNYPLGPYIADKLPPNPYDDSNKVTAVAAPGQKPAGPVGNLGGWLYDVSNGAIWPNNPQYYGL